MHAVSWNPNSSEFCVVYGFMPAKATFFNLKCDPTFEVGEGDRNSIYYNDFGTHILYQIALFAGAVCLCLHVCVQIVFLNPPVRSH